MIRTGKKFSKPEMSRVINGDKILATEPEKEEKKRLDMILVGIYKSYNRSTLQKFIEKGFVKVDGELVTKANAKFPEGVYIEMTIPEELKNADLVPETVFEDENVIVFNKPAGLLSEFKGEYSPEMTLAHYGLIVHRLDRDTSGVIIVAKKPEVQSYLRRQFQDRKTKKTYYAVVSGRPKLDAARIDLPMARDLKRPTTFRVDPNGKEAETFYRVLKTDGKHSLVELKPTTGRTHHVRVHMKYIVPPFVGAPVYGEEPGERLFLHAGELEITIPEGDRRIFKVPMPEGFAEMIEDAPDAGMDAEEAERK